MLWIVHPPQASPEFFSYFAASRWFNRKHLCYSCDTKIIDSNTNFKLWSSKYPSFVHCHKRFNYGIKMKIADWEETTLIHCQIQSLIADWTSIKSLLYRNNKQPRSLEARRYRLYFGPVLSYYYIQWHKMLAQYSPIFAWLVSGIHDVYYYDIMFL